MSKYSVIFYWGDYKERQESANEDGVICYIEQHFNASASPHPNYAMAIVGSNASQQSLAMAKFYADECDRLFGLGKFGEDGVSLGGFNGRGDGNLVYTDMPAVLLEPMFCSNPEAAVTIKSTQGQEDLASIIVACIKKFFPDGGKVGFSVGHKGKTSNPADMGAVVYRGGTEAEYAEIVLDKAAEMLMDGEEYGEVSDLLLVARRVHDAAGDMIKILEAMDVKEKSDGSSVRAHSWNL